MNEPNLPEEQMRLWTPRRPSASLKPKIFSSAKNHFAAAETLSPASARFFLGALTPTLACALLTLMMLNHGGDSHSTASSLIWNGDRFVADSSHSAQNHWASVTFDWTNHSAFQSSIRFTPSTNLTQ